MARTHFKTKAGTELPLLNLKGKEYLQVCWRLVWFREERLDWSVETELLQVNEKATLARAIIRDAQGRVVATAHKSENVQGFADHSEKAETGAIGRALALCGFGTQFAADELDEGKRLADAPIGTSSNRVEEPGQDDGANTIPSSHYIISFGKFNKKTLEELYRDPTVGAKGLSGYIDYIEATAKKKSQPVTGLALEFVERCSEFLGAMENGWDPQGPSGIHSENGSMR